MAAPALLGLARIIQGLSLGGEYGTSATYLTEVADEKHRGFYSSFQYVTLIGGQLCAILVLLLLQQVFLTADQLKAWGWRIPFVIGALLAIIALIMRRNLHETDDFLAAKKLPRRESSVKALLKYPREVLLVVGLTMGGTTAFYTYTTYMQKFLKLSVGLNDTQTTLVTAGSLIFGLFLQPIYGALSDKIGRKALLIWFGVTGDSVHHSVAVFPAGGPERASCLPADLRSLADRGGLHIDQRRRESRAVSNERKGDRRGVALRRNRVDLRRHGGVDRALVQIHRPRDLVLLLSDGRDRDVLAGLHDDA